MGSREVHVALYPTRIGHGAALQQAAMDKAGVARSQGVGATVRNERRVDAV